MAFSLVHTEVKCRYCYSWRQKLQPNECNELCDTCYFTLENSPDIVSLGTTFCQRNIPHENSSHNILSALLLERCYISNKTPFKIFKDRVTWTILSKVLTWLTLEVRKKICSFYHLDELALKGDTGGNLNIPACHFRQSLMSCPCNNQF